MWVPETHSEPFDIVVKDGVEFSFSKPTADEIRIAVRVWYRLGEIQRDLRVKYLRLLLEDLRGLGKMGALYAPGQLHGIIGIT